MTTPKQKLNDASLEILEKMVSSEKTKLERIMKEIPLNNKNYHHAKCIYCEKIRNQLLEVLYFYGIIDQKETTQ